MVAAVEILPNANPRRRSLAAILCQVLRRRSVRFLANQANRIKLKTLHYEHTLGALSVSLNALRHRVSSRNLSSSYASHAGRLAVRSHHNGRHTALGPHKIGARPQPVTFLLLRCRENNPKLNRKKCTFLQLEVRYLGHIISIEGLCLVPHRVKAILEMKEAKNCKELQVFLGMMDYAQRFIPNMSDVTAPL